MILATELIKKHAESYRYIIKLLSQRVNFEYFALDLFSQDIKLRTLLTVNNLKVPISGFQWNLFIKLRV